MEQSARSRLIPSVERATHAVALWIEGSLGDSGLTQAEAHILAHLAQVGSSSINDLHHDFGHRRSTLTGILDRLERRGLVRRVPHPTSRRSVMIETTEQGLEAGRQVLALLDALEATVERQATTNDIDGFYRVLRAIEEATHDRR